MLLGAYELIYAVLTALSSKPFFFRAFSMKLDLAPKFAAVDVKLTSVRMELRAPLTLPVLKSCRSGLASYKMLGVLGAILLP